MNRLICRAALAAALATLLSPAPAHAQGYTFATLHSFTATGRDGVNTDGAHPNSYAVSDGQGHVFGTTPSGGSGGYGTFYEYDIPTTIYTTLITFSGGFNVNGAAPNSLTLDGQGNLFGTTYSGGTKFGGTIFKYDTASNTFTTLVDIDQSAAASPFAGVTLDGQGHLFGTTVANGAKGYGTVFEYTLTSKQFTILASFGGNAGHPQGKVALDGLGHIYGITTQGGASGYGTVFQYTLATHALKTLVSFNNVNGAYPRGGLVSDGAGAVYGTTAAGGRYRSGVFGSGTLFKINTANGNMTTVLVFGQGNGKGNADPTGDLSVDGQGHLYGTTQSGGPYGDGTVYKFNLATHALATLHVFSGPDGAHPLGGVSTDSNGALYGTTYEGGANFTGTVFSLTPAPGG